MAIVLYDQQNGGLLNLHHTEVPKHLEGKKIGHDLAKVSVITLLSQILIH